MPHAHDIAVSQTALQLCTEQPTKRHESNLHWWHQLVAIGEMRWRRQGRLGDVDLHK